MEIVKASENDRDWILRHRVEMFRDMGMSEEGLIKTEAITREELENGFDDRSMFFLAKEGEEVIGGSGVAICKILPSRNNTTGEFAYIFNMYVEKNHRRKGVASALLQHIIDECLTKNIDRFYLHASDEGRLVYLKMGFNKSDNFYEIRPW